MVRRGSSWVGAWYSKLIWLTPIETFEIVAKQIFTLYPSGLSLGLVSALAAGVENFLALFRQQLSAKCSWLYFDSGAAGDNFRVFFVFFFHP